MRCGGVYVASYTQQSVNPISFLHMKSFYVKSCSTHFTKELICQTYYVLTSTSIELHSPSAHKEQSCIHSSRFIRSSFSFSRPFVFDNSGKAHIKMVRIDFTIKIGGYQRQQVENYPQSLKSRVYTEFFYRKGGC